MLPSEGSNGAKAPTWRCTGSGTTSPVARSIARVVICSLVVHFVRRPAFYALPPSAPRLTPARVEERASDQNQTRSYHCNCTGAGLRQDREQAGTELASLGRSDPEHTRTMPITRILVPNKVNRTHLLCCVRDAAASRAKIRLCSGFGRSGKLQRSVKARPVDRRTCLRFLPWCPGGRGEAAAHVRSNVRAPAFLYMPNAIRRASASVRVSESPLTALRS